MSRKLMQNNTLYYRLPPILRDSLEKGQGEDEVSPQKADYFRQDFPSKPRKDLKKDNRIIQVALSDWKFLNCFKKVFVTAQD